MTKGLSTGQTIMCHRHVSEVQRAVTDRAARRGGRAETLQFVIMTQLINFLFMLITSFTYKLFRELTRLLKFNTF